jgi:hypothetical protein
VRGERRQTQSVGERLFEREGVDLTRRRRDAEEDAEG